MTQPAEEKLPFRFYDRNKQTVDLSQHLEGVPGIFIVGGGPSMKDNDLSLMDRRGVWSIAVNNVAGTDLFRPSAFTFGDPPKKFHNGIWQDPNIMKFLPLPKMKRGRGSLRRKLDVPRTETKDGEEVLITHEATGKTVMDCPNIWGFRRRSWILPDDSFFEDEAAWGNLQKGVDKTGLEKTACSFLFAIRLAYELGARRVFLLGVDFNMSKKYAFDQERTPGAIESNNNQFRVANGWLTTMQEDGVFERAGMEIWNTNRESGLTAFPFCPYRDAMAMCLQGFPKEPFDLSGWYEK